jgi:23S rRNA (adenine2503-C2)-methyltransferase
MEYKVFKSSDTNVSKFVFEWKDEWTWDESCADPYKKYTNHKAIAEAVLYRYGQYKKRTVICCSVQSGCPVGCTFCGTGKFFVRSLTNIEIVEQVKTVLSTIDCSTNEIEKFQIMFMSMGEPFLNYNELARAIYKLADLYPNAQLLVSTSAPKGILNNFVDFIHVSSDLTQVGLQFSVHESTDEARRKLIPTNTSTLRQIACLGETWAAYVGRKPFFNYCVHEGNGSEEDADRLLKLFNPDVWEVTLSVICEKDESVKSSIERQLDLINKFKNYLLDRGFSIRVFNPAGQDDIGGGCGQLWYFQEWMKNNKLKYK